MFRHGNTSCQRSSYESSCISHQLVVFGFVFVFAFAFAFGVAFVVGFAFGFVVEFAFGVAFVFVFAFAFVVAFVFAFVVGFGDIMSDKPIITALVPYFGGKRNLASKIVAEIGSHRVWWDPFCGSLAVLFAKPACRMETVNDLYGDLTNLARVLQDEALALALYSNLTRTLMAESLFQDSADVLRQPIPSLTPSADRAYHFMVVSWLGRNGVTGTMSYNAGYCVRYTSNGGHAARRWRSVVDSIPAWHDRLRNVTILSRDAFDLIPRIEDKDGTVIYVDPPYIVKGAKYVHDFTEAQHRELAELLSRFKRTRVIVSYYDHPLIDALYDGWTKRTFEVTRAMANQGQRQRGKVKVCEVLMINGSSYMDEAGSLF